MSRTYQVLASLALGHNYYADGKCKDVEVIASSETQSLLKKLRLLWASLEKQQASNYRLMQTYAGANPLISIPDGSVLRFYLKATAADFKDFTQDVAANPGEMIRWYNDAAGDLVNETLPLFGDSVAFGGMLSGLEVTATAANGASVKEVSHDREGSGFVTMDLSNMPSGKYVFTWSGGSFEAYKDANLLGGSYIGVLELQQTTTISLNHSFELNFLAVARTWFYCVFLKGSWPLDGTVKLAAEPTIGGSGFDYFLDSPIVYPNVDLVELDELKGPDRTLHIFYSDGPIASSEISQNIEIHHFPSSGGGSTFNKIHQYFPNPKRGDPNALVFVSLDRSKL